MTRQEKIKLLEGIWVGEIHPGELIEPKFYILRRGKIIDFHSEPPSLPELSFEQFCKVFRPKKDILGLGASGMPPKGIKSDPSGTILKKIIEQFPELETPNHRKFIEMCDNLERWYNERFGEEHFYKAQKTVGSW